MANRQPRCPSIGFDSDNLTARWRAVSAVTPDTFATCASSSAECGKNSCKGGSSKRMVTGLPAIMLNSDSKSLRCIGNNFANAASRPLVSLAIIICRTAMIRSASKNICSVRHRPIPSAPKSSATWASVVVSALARTPSRRRSSAHFIMVPNALDIFG